MFCLCNMKEFDMMHMALYENSAGHQSCCDHPDDDTTICTKFHGQSSCVMLTSEEKSHDQ